MAPSVQLWGLMTSRERGADAGVLGRTFFGTGQSWLSNKQHLDLGSYSS